MYFSLPPGSLLFIAREIAVSSMERVASLLGRTIGRAGAAVAGVRRASTEESFEVLDGPSGLVIRLRFAPSFILDFGIWALAIETIVELMLGSHLEVIILKFGVAAEGIRGEPMGE